MALSRSRVTSQGQVSIPVEVRRKLGVGPGSIVEWTEEGNQIVVRRCGTFSSVDIHNVLFSKKPVVPRSVEEMKAGIRRRARERHARD
jgi:AbrB family looped-hinge helix DNA binding protein